MKRKNMTRNALITSIISMLLCVSMLVGATFAWFTDSVESGRNTIAAGNLDVELYNQDGQVTGSTILFDDVTPNLWEPGAVAYEDLQIKNVGSLALKYSLELNVLNETIVNGYKLSDVIKVGIVKGGVGNATREEVIAGVTTWTKLSNFKFNQNGVKLEAGAQTEVFGVVLYWQPNDNETDNHYNMNNENKGQVLKLDIGVTLTAAQIQHENDSFGDDYDESATPWMGEINTNWYTADPDAAQFVLTTPEELAGLAAIVNGTATTGATTFDLKSTPQTLQDSFSGQTIVLGGDIDLANATWTPIGTSANAFMGTFDGQGYTVSNLKVTGRGSNVGLFGFTTDGEIKNLTVENAYVTGRLNVAVVAGTPYTSKYTNIKVTGHVEVDGLAYVGAVGGKNAYANWDQITVDVDDDSYVKAYSIEAGTAYRTYVGGVIGFMGEGGHKISNVTSNIDVFGSTCDVGGIVGIAHYGNIFENITCTGNVTITNATEADEAEEMGGIAGVWHNGGSDVTFTNCVFSGELSANIEGVDLSDNTITGKEYSASGNGKLIIDGKTTVVVSNATGLKAALTNGADEIKLCANIDMGSEKLTVAQDVVLELNGYVLSGTCNAGQGHLIMVNNGAALDIKDRSITKTGKITYAQGSNNVGWAIDLEGELNLYSGTIELTGESWSIGYCVDVRPNAWGSNYTEDTVFHMYGGKIVSSDGAIRVASSSSDTYGNIVASFIMDGGEIDAAWDGIFVQQSNAAYDTLNVTINNGTVTSALSPIRVYGPAATSVNAGTEKPMTITVNGGDLVMNGTPDESRVWHTLGKIVIGGGMTLEELNQYTTITIA